MSSLPQKMRDDLDFSYSVINLNLINKLISKDGTIKFLFELYDNKFIESVYLKDKNNRVTFCISTQSGCRMGCTFCKTGKMGLLRNLNFTEIISQILFLFKIMSEDTSVVDKAFNIVFMGMGEPLDNFDNLVNVINILIDKFYFGLSQSRITISTCGLLDKINNIFEIFPNIKLALSLNSANQKKRESIMRIAKKYSINDIYNVLSSCYEKYKNRITIEYVLIKNFNMDDNDINDLELFNSSAFHINLIPLNHNDEKINRPSENEISIFQKKLEQKGFIVTRRYRRGDDISADCGQLYWDNKI